MNSTSYLYAVGKINAVKFVFVLLMASVYLFVVTPGFTAGDPTDRANLRETKRLEKQLQLMSDLNLDSPPVVNRNADGPISHAVEKLDDYHYSVFSYPKFYYGKDGLLKETKIDLQASKYNPDEWEINEAVYQFTAQKGAAFTVFHYGMYIYYSLVDIAYQDIESGRIESLQWDRSQNSPSLAQGRRMFWTDIFPGIDLEVILSEDYIKENIHLTQAAREKLPDPARFGLNPQTTNIVFVYSLQIQDTSGKYELKDQSGVRTPDSSFEFNGELQFTRENKTPHVFSRDYAILPGYQDNYITPYLTQPITKRWHSGENGWNMLTYGIPYATHQSAEPGTIIIDPTLRFQEGIGSYSGTSAATIYANGTTDNYNYGIDDTLKLAKNTTSNVQQSVLIKFDGITSLGLTPSIVTSAEILMKLKNIEGTYDSANVTAKAYRLILSWNEGAGWGGIYSGGCAWNYAVYNTTAWGTAGAKNTSSDRNSTHEDDESLVASAGSWDGWDITNAVDSWVGGSSSNYGVVIEPTWANKPYGFVYYSDDDSTGANRPYLNIETSCTYANPGVDEEYEYLGEAYPTADGVSFNPSPSNWVSGQEITMTWELQTTVNDPQTYGFGQFLRMWIDLNGDCIFAPSTSISIKSSEEVDLRSTGGTQYPYVVENTSPNPSVCNFTPKNEVDTFQVTSAYQIHTFTYKFNVPTLTFNGKITTRTRVYLRFGGWPPNDATETLDDPNPNDWCDSYWGDFEDYDVTITR